MAVRSWTCEGCTNICYRLIRGEVSEYCRPVIERGEVKRQWVSGDFVNCLEKTTDPGATDYTVRIHECYTGR